MPPIQQQQTSRAGLITSLVISIMVGLSLLVWAIMANSERRKVELERDRVVAESRKIYSESELEPLRTLKNETEYASANTLLDIATRQRDEAVKLIAGDGKTLKDARAEVARVRQTVTEKVKGSAVGTDQLTTAIDSLVQRIEADAAAVKKAQDDVKAAQAAADQQKTQLENAVAEQKKAAEAAAAATNAEKQRAEAAIAEKQKQVDDFSKQVDDTKKALNDAQVAQQAETAKLAQDIKKLQDEREKLLGILARYRPNVKEAVVRNVDCTVSQLGETGTCYVNLGFGDHVVPGLTFEVYDKIDGVPPLAAGTSNFDLPKGKASLEIIEVGQNSSRCRITTLAQGKVVQQGDVCANIVYDKNIKPVFYVYGSFDMDNNGVPTPGEAEVIKGLINRWGGKVADKLGPEVDFVVVGKEPVIPNYTPEEKQNPVLNQRFEQATAEAKAYNDIVNKAGELHIPTLNQNRFLYYTGYFDASKR